MFNIHLHTHKKGHLSRLLRLLLTRFSSVHSFTSPENRHYVQSISIEDNSEFLLLNTEQQNAYRVSHSAHCLITPFALYLDVKDEHQSRFQGWIFKWSVGDTNFRRLSRWISRWNVRLNR